jgi:hypothetical protein
MKVYQLIKKKIKFPSPESSDCEELEFEIDSKKKDCCSILKIAI